ncbi:MAG: hypothetical protein JF612_04045 [Planctomycetia bacterium]|nr:hypothetical protein [Planctomycetia bacterium]
MLSPETSLSRSLQSQRPKNLSRPAPTRARTYFTETPGTTEALPSVSGAPLSPEGLPVPPEMYYNEGNVGDGIVEGNGYYNDACCGPCGLFGPKRCGGACGGDCRWIPLCLFVPLPSLACFEVFGGAQGFTGPANRGGSGSFGFHEGFNWGTPLAGFLSGQWGVNWTQSNFSGTFFTPDSREQIFLTTGLFRRVDWGFQGGLVFDYLHDEWDYSADLAQLRGELSWLCPGAPSCGCNEIGFWFTAGVHDASNLAMRQPIFASDGSVRVINSNGTLAVNDLYAFFFRRQFASGGQGRLFGGFTSNSQGLVGGDAQLPINPNWSLRSNFIFVSSGNGDSTTEPGFARESWNVGISLVWTPCPRCIGGPNYNRPLFNVADNGSFLTRLTR